MVSIIIPVYNQAKKLPKTLESIFHQTYHDYEVIIVNDGSTDNVDRVIRKYEIQFETKNKTPLLARGRSRFKYIDQTNMGANFARNNGRALAVGDYYLFCDADVVLEKNCLEEMVNALETNPDKAYAYSSYMWGKKLFKLAPFDAEKLKQLPSIHTTTLVRKHLFPGFDVRIFKFQDWDVWLTMLEDGHTGIFIDKVLFKVATGGTMSKWLPSFAYKWLPFLPAVKSYKRGMEIIKIKHKLVKNEK